MSITQLNGQFLTPEAVLRGLLDSLDHPCGCGQVSASCECEETQLNEQIVALQQETNNIRAQISEAERLLQMRDQMYTELDQLREQRNQIQGEIEGQIDYQRTETFKASGYKEMNERLRRRIYEVRQYIQKMTFQNQKIEEGMITNQYREKEEEYVSRRNVYYSPPSYEGRRQYTPNLQSMLSRIQDKQEDAWRRVRRQEEEIDRRNADTRMRKTNAGGFTYYSPKSRTFYSPTRTIY